MDRTPTFRTPNGLLTGQQAIDAWRAQTASCSCNAGGDEECAVSGTCRDMPAKWLGCPYCTGTAVGRPLVYRLPSQMGID